RDKLKWDELFTEKGADCRASLSDPIGKHPLIWIKDTNRLTSPEGKRLNKFISESGYCSRREADKLIEQNRVLLNGRIPELGTRVLEGDRVQVDGRTIGAIDVNHDDRVYIAYHKPVGIT